ncbi:unnamed protein product [Symbiodinium sp. CCMP2592]|nr:unnamed protein product [Symbiodinium sp. CCMP2592]
MATPKASHHPTGPDSDATADAVGDLAIAKSSVGFIDESRLTCYSSMLSSLEKGDLPRSQWVAHVLHRLDEHFGSVAIPAKETVKQVVELGEEVPRFRSKRNWKPFLFLPCILMSFATDSPDTVCPVVCGFSPVHYVPLWYGTFCLTIIFCWWRGRSVDHDSYYAKRGGVKGHRASAVALFLDCSRAGYSDRHLIVLFVVFTLCAVHSVLVRWASLLEEGGINNGCIGYGDWSSLADVCHQGPFLEQGWPVFLVIYFMVFFGALMDQGIIGAKEPFGCKQGLRKARGRKLAARKRQAVWEKFACHLFTVDSIQSASPAEEVRRALYRFAQQTVPMPLLSVCELIDSKLSEEEGVYVWPQSSIGFVSLPRVLPSEMELGEPEDLAVSWVRGLGFSVSWAFIRWPMSANRTAAHLKALQQRAHLMHADMNRSETTSTQQPTAKIQAHQVAPNPSHLPQPLNPKVKARKLEFDYPNPSMVNYRVSYPETIFQLSGVPFKP